MNHPDERENGGVRHTTSKATLRILTGLAGSGKTQRCLQAFRTTLRDALGSGRPARVLWLTPSDASRRDVLARLPDDSLPACFAPNVMTFAQFAERLLEAAHSAPDAAQRSAAKRSLHPAGRRRLLRTIIDGLGASSELAHFGAIAGTTGFLALVESFIAELKRGEIWPEGFAEVCRRRGGRPKDRDLLLIYERYQARLVETGLYDAEGCFWSARDVLQREGAGPFAGRELVVVDGFTDFTKTQYEILGLLARDCRSMIVTLLLETPLRRDDLFAKTAEALQLLQAELSGIADVEIEPCEAGAAQNADDIPQSIARIAAHLFEVPGESPPSPHADGIEVLAVTGATSEIDAIAERVKSLLLGGVDPADVVVACRSLQDAAETLVRRLSAAGIPVWCEAGIALANAPAVRALLEVVRLQLEDWPFERLKAVLHSNYFRPDWFPDDLRERSRALLRSLRQFKLQAQQNVIRRVLKKRAESANDGGARELLERLCDALDALKRKTDFAGWVRRLVQLARELGIAPPSGSESPADAPEEDRDRRVWERLEDVLFAAAEAEQIDGGKPRKYALDEFASAAIEVLQAQQLPPDSDRRGRVRVVETSQVRNLDVPHLFLAGLTEQSFPQARRDDCFFSERERRELHRQGLPMSHHARQTQDEMLLFYGIATRARKGLTLSYAEVGAGGEPLFPSPFVTALLQLFGRDALSAKAVGDLDPVPPADRVLAPADLRRVAVVELQESRPGLFRGAAAVPELTGATENVLAAAEANAARFETRGWTRYEGLIVDSALRKKLRGRFPTDYQFSASQLESYASCRFRFFLSDVLHVEPLEPPVAATDYRRRGTLVHDVLAALHRELGGDASDAAQLAERFRAHVAERLDRRIDDTNLAAALTEVERRLLQDWAGTYARQWDEYRSRFESAWSSPPAPQHLELPFGDAPGEDDHGGERFPAVEFGSKDNLVRLRGRIDRIDVGEIDDRTVFNVIDYKTGRPPRFSVEDVQSGRALQLALYTLAVLRLGIVGGESRPFQMGYWSVRETGFVPGLKGGPRKLAPLDRTVLESLERMLDELLPRLAEEMRCGFFPVDSDDPACTQFCPYNTVCRITQLRPLREALGKQGGMKE